MNQKGGTAKTTTAVNISVALAEIGHRVVLIDLDPQASATSWLGHSPAMDLADAIIEGVPLALQATKVDGLELVPASKALAAADRQLSSEPGIQTALRDAIAKLPERDYVIIDCPPALGLLSVMALAAAPEALVPVGAGSMELGGLAELRGTIEEVRERLHPDLRMSTVLACRIDMRGGRPTRISSAVVDSLRRHFPEALLLSDPREHAAERGPSHQQPISHYDPDGQAARDYRADASELAGVHRGA